MSEENKNVRCDLCGEEVSSQNAIRFDGTILCTDCFNQRVTECSHCGRSIWRDDSRKMCIRDRQRPLLKMCKIVMQLSMDYKSMKSI